MMFRGGVMRTVLVGAALAALLPALFYGAVPEVHVQGNPAVPVGLPPSGTAESGTGINVTTAFSDLTLGSDTSDADCAFRAGVVGAGTCEGNGIGME